MKKVIVFKVEDVLVKSVNVEGMDEVRGRKMVKGWVGEEMYGMEFVKDGKEVMKLEEMVGKMVVLEKRFEEEGNDEKRFWMRDLRRKLEGWLEERGNRSELKDLERICEIVGGKMVFVSKERKGKVVGLLVNNGLREFEVVGDLGCLEVDEKDMVVFEKEEELKDMWDKIGLKRG